MFSKKQEASGSINAAHTNLQMAKSRLQEVWEKQEENLTNLELIKNDKLLSDIALEMGEIKMLHHKFEDIAARRR